jgi:hypothetical protein
MFCLDIKKGVSMWIVGCAMRFYPSVRSFDTYNEAKEYYDSVELDEYEPMAIYIAQVSEFKESHYKYDKDDEE